MKNFKIISMMMVLIIAVSACNKDEKHLTKGQWVLKGMTISPPVMGFSDIYSTMEACSKDDFIIFKEEGTYVVDEGPTKCDDNDPQTTTGTWSLDKEDKNLYLTIDTS